jgi:spore coat polysaccharide biosynthesis protein SpsF
MNASPSVLFRCDGSPKVGLGHVVRCLALADELHEVHGCQVAFAMRDGPLGFEMVLEKGYALVNAPQEPFNYTRWLMESFSDGPPQVLVLDVRDELTRADVEKLREQGNLIVVVDDISERRLAADLAFYPPVPQVRRLNWLGFTGQLYVGWDWVVLRREFAHCPPPAHHDPPTVLVSMGGSDPAGLTMVAVKALDSVNESFEVIVLLGPGFSHNEELRNMVAVSRRKFNMQSDVADVMGLMARADLAVASFGVTAYELAAVGTPAIYLCLTEDHAESASLFADAGTGVNLGLYAEVSPERVSQSVGALLLDPALRRTMAGTGRSLVDGGGVERIADILMRLSSHRLSKYAERS